MSGEKPDTQTDDLPEAAQEAESPTTEEILTSCLISRDRVMKCHRGLVAQQARLMAFVERYERQRLRLFNERLAAAGQAVCVVCAEHGRPFLQPKTAIQYIVSHENISSSGQSSRLMTVCPSCWENHFIKGWESRAFHGSVATDAYWRRIFDARPNPDRTPPYEVFGPSGWEGLPENTEMSIAADQIPPDLATVYSLPPKIDYTEGDFRLLIGGQRYFRESN